MNQHNGYTPIQYAILQVLSDGRPHPRADLHACCEATEVVNVRVHVSLLRKKLRDKGEDIVYVKMRGYQHVRLLSNPYE